MTKFYAKTQTFEPPYESKHWGSEHALEALKNDLKDKDWYEVGDGRHSIGNSGILIEIPQIKDDLEYFNITIS